MASPTGLRKICECEWLEAKLNGRHYGSKVSQYLSGCRGVFGTKRGDIRTRKFSGALLNNVEHFRHHRSGDEKLSPEKREAALVQIKRVRPISTIPKFVAIRRHRGEK